MLSKKNFLVGAGFGIVVMLAFLLTLPDRKLHMVFCDVGQGDATYIRTPSNNDILIDGGPDNSVLSCLGRHMPFYDRRIDLVVVTHPQKDHYKGLEEVVRRFQIGNIIMLPVDEPGEQWKKFSDYIMTKNITVRNSFSGDEVKMDNSSIRILWPDKSFVEAHSVKVESNGSSVLGISDEDINLMSYYILVKHGGFSGLLTGDGDSRAQKFMERGSLPDIDVLKVPHHGSKYAFGKGFLDALTPELAVISVGKNPWGHPTEETIRQLSDKAIRILRTDKDGDIEVISDGKNWKVKTD